MDDRLQLVPTARLELARLSPLPPQDSVSTNFTTSAWPPDCARAAANAARIIAFMRRKKNLVVAREALYFGMSLAFDSGGTIPGAGTESGAGAGWVAALSITLFDSAGRTFAI